MTSTNPIPPKNRSIVLCIRKIWGAVLTSTTLSPVVLSPLVVSNTACVTEYVPLSTNGIAVTKMTMTHVPRTTIIS